MANQSLPLPLCPDVKARLSMDKGERSGKITFSNPEFPTIGFVLNPIDKRGHIFEAAYMTADDKPLLGYRLISRSLPGQPLSVVDVLRGLKIESPTSIRCAPKRPSDADTYGMGFSTTRFVRLSAHTSLTRRTRQKRKEPTASSTVGVLRFANTCKTTCVRKRKRTNLSSSST